MERGGYGQRPAWSVLWFKQRRRRREREGVTVGGWVLDTAEEGHSP